MTFIPIDRENEVKLKKDRNIDQSSGDRKGVKKKANEKYDKPKI